MQKYGMRSFSEGKEKKVFFFTVDTANNKCYVYPRKSL